MRRWAPHRALPNESSLIELVDFDDSDSGAEPVSVLSPPSRRTRVLGVLVVVALGLTFLVGRLSAGRSLPGAWPGDVVRAGGGCDRPSFRANLVEDQAHPDALTVMRSRLPDFRVLGAQRAVYVDTLELCRIDIRATDGAGVRLHIVVEPGPAPSRNGSATVTVRPTGEGAVTDLAFRVATGFVVTVEVAAPLAGQAPALSALLELLADPELAA